MFEHRIGVEPEVRQLKIYLSAIDPVQFVSQGIGLHWVIGKTTLFRGAQCGVLGS
jgi:hypothetical protein